MARNNPNDQSPNPSKRWFSWDGSKGNLKYYDKEQEKEIRVDLPFGFILLDRLATIKGWHDPSESQIYSNEVRRTTDEPFTVRAFKMKEIVAQGFYGDIKDRIKASGGRFNINLYIAFRDESKELAIGSLSLHGAPMSAWIEFEKSNKSEIFKKAVEITGYDEGKKGGITFRKPTLELVEIPEDADDQAGELQKELQKYLVKYLSRRSTQPNSEPDAEEVPDHIEPEEPF